ncbi:MAG: tRNA uridine-5-carboxymethylaminomethyl(34) synthesis GTPase MnmE [Candidatus Latescibacterota bacterium]|nr:tRNA uridine-5-carboxymethylaminomethyl(34) synthesis GTPase MnmE [Candidatus Latescibacterota bacterium]
MAALSNTDTIVAVASPRGEGGIGVIRLSGPAAAATAAQLFHSAKTIGHRPHRVEYGKVRDAQGREIDTALAWFLPGPKSYTGEDTVEISTHGSEAVLQAVLETAVESGARMAEAGEFTRRAFINGKLDLPQAEAVVDLIRAGSRSGLMTAYGAASGGLSKVVAEVKAEIVAALALLEVGLDFVDEDVDTPSMAQVDAHVLAVERRARELVESFAGARRRLQGWQVAIVGRPNVGKSTLLNALLSEERAIVSETPGTTRDVVEGRVIWAGESLRLVDTAGQRRNPGPVEAEGIRRARQRAEEADLVLVVLDRSREWSSEDEWVIGAAGNSPRLLVLNKADLSPRLQLPASLEEPEFVAVSATTGSGLEGLRSRILRHTRSMKPEAAVSLLRDRHRERMSSVADRASRAREQLSALTPEIAAAELRNALEDVGELLGEEVEEAVLDRIFAEFCIGK